MRLATSIEHLFDYSRQRIQQRPLITVIGGGILAYLFAFGIPFLISTGFQLRMSETLFSFLILGLFAASSAFLVVYFHWSVARFAQNRVAQVLNFLGAMVFPTLMFVAWGSMLMFRGMD